MTRQQLIDYVAEEYGVLPDNPFKGDFVSAIFRHKSNKKWFAALLQVKRDKIVKGSDKVVEVLDLKCDPMLRPAVLKFKGVYTAYHMNKKHWYTICLDNSISSDEICRRLDISYLLAK